MQVLDQFGLIHYELGDPLKDPNDITAFIILLLAICLLGVSNWTAYHKTIYGLLLAPDFSCMNAKESVHERVKSYFLNICAAVGASLKTLASSGSLYYLSKRFCGPTVGIAITLVCLPGNFLSQFSFFVKTKNPANDKRYQTMVITADRKNDETEDEQYSDYDDYIPTEKQRLLRDMQTIS